MPSQLLQVFGLKVNDLTKATFDRLGMYRRKDLLHGLRVIVFNGPQGHGFKEDSRDGPCFQNHGDSSVREHLFAGRGRLTANPAAGML